MFGKLCVKNVRIVSGFVKYFGDEYDTISKFIGSLLIRK